jgi:hypothetical protein
MCQANLDLMLKGNGVLVLARRLVQIFIDAAGNLITSN